MIDYHDQVALPGDPDLDCEIEGIAVTAVIITADEQEALIHLRGGEGYWLDADGDMVQVDHVDHVTSRVRFPDMPPAAFAQFTDQLHQWRDAGTPLRMCCAPGKVTALIEGPRNFVFLPRRKDPLG